MFWEHDSALKQGQHSPCAIFSKDDVAFGPRITEIWQHGDNLAAGTAKTEWVAISSQLPCIKESLLILKSFHKVSYVSFKLLSKGAVVHRVVNS